MIIIGEKINGSIPSVGKAIANRDADWIRNLAKVQAEAKADYLDCCASVNVDELETIKWLIDLIQETTDLPICIDSPDPQVCADAMQFCNKVGIVNSVSLEGNKIDTIFPAIAGTGWGCVALLCDDSGIPKTSARRIEIFKEIMAKAEEFDIAPERLYIDPLVETLGTNGKSFLTFAETTKVIKELYPNVHITSGLSNISFGLPVRKMINMSFMVLAMQAGMDSAIVDPTNRDMMGIIYATDALLGNDDFCMEYIGAYRDNIFGPPPKD